MFICNIQTRKANALFSLQPNLAKMNSVESCPLSFALNFSWLALMRLLSTKEMQLDGDAERNHSFLSPRWGRLASARAFLALWPLLSLLFSTHVLLFNAPCFFPAMPCCLICLINFIPIFMLLLRWTDSFQGLAHFLRGDSRNEMASRENLVYLLPCTLQGKSGMVPYATLIQGHTLLITCKLRWAMWSNQQIL